MEISVCFITSPNVTRSHSTSMEDNKDLNLENYHPT